MTTDKSWFHQHDPLSRRESKEWLQRHEDWGQVVCRELSVKKVMLIPFFDSHGFVHWEYFRDQSITKEVFLPVIQHAYQAIQVHRREAWNNKSKYLLHMDNALAHWSRLVQGHLRAINWPMLKHPPYSPDLSPSDFFLFPRTKKAIRGIRFPNLDVPIVTIEHQLQSIPSQAWQDCFQDWITRCRRCVAFNGHYFEGMKQLPA